MADEEQTNAPRILDESDKELTLDQVDYEKGYLIPDSVLKEHHPAVEGQERKFHYWPMTYYFEDGTTYEVTSVDDPKVKPNDDGVSFDFVGQTDEEKSKVIRGVDVKEVEDQPQIEAKDAWDEYESIQRYKLYTEEELKANKERKDKEAKEAAFLSTGPDRLTTSESDIEDINIMLADMMGVTENA